MANLLAPRSTMSSGVGSEWSDWGDRDSNQWSNPQESSTTQASPLAIVVANGKVVGEGNSNGTWPGETMGGCKGDDQGDGKGKGNGGGKAKGKGDGDGKGKVNGKGGK